MADRNYQGVDYFFTVKTYPDGSKQFACTVNGDRMTTWYDTHAEAEAELFSMIDD